MMTIEEEVSRRRCADVSRTSPQAWCVVRRYSDTGKPIYTEWSMDSWESKQKQIRLHGGREDGLDPELVATYRLGEVDCPDYPPTDLIV